MIYMDYLDGMSTCLFFIILKNRRKFRQFQLHYLFLMQSWSRGHAADQQELIEIAKSAADQRSRIIVVAEHWYFSTKSEAATSVVADIDAVE